MARRCICLTLAAMSLVLGGTTRATAQTPASYNYERAYRHFLGSRYSYRTFYWSVPGSGSLVVTPFVYQSRFIEPSYSRQRITPYGYERFDTVPGMGGTTLMPFGFSSYYYPGFARSLYAPYGGPMIEYFYP